MTIVERREAEVVPRGLSVTRTYYADYWRLRIGDRMVRLVVPNPRVGRVKRSCKLVKL
jgi:hypothetical protein